MTTPPSTRAKRKKKPQRSGGSILWSALLAYASIFNTVASTHNDRLSDLHMAVAVVSFAALFAELRKELRWWMGMVAAARVEWIPPVAAEDLRGLDGD